MPTDATTNVNTLAKSIGYIVDRTKLDQNYLGNVWLIDNDKVATCAHLVSSYANYLEALMVRFPGTGKEYGIESIMFHPDFDRNMASELLHGSLTAPSPAIPLQKHNAAVLNLKDTMAEVNDSLAFKVGKNLSLPVPPREQGLGGNLREIDLFVVIQSITNARKEGIVTICDERNYPVARLFCQEGRLLYAKYRNLINEMAIYQIVNRELDGNFFFWAADKPNWDVTTAIAKPADTVLIEAHRRFDELKSLIPLIGKPDILFEKKVDQPNLEILPGDTQDYCKLLWDYFDGGTPVGQLWQVSNLDDYAIYATLSELKRTQQIGISVKSPLEPKEGDEPAKPLSMAVNTALNPDDKIRNIHIDIDSDRALEREGSLLGTLRAQDKYHLLHNVRLVPEAAGSPIFKDDLVVGMHCGELPPNFENRNHNGELQGMLWVDSIVECLRGGGNEELAEELTLFDLPQGEKPKRKPPGGCKEVAKLDCPKCGRTSLESSKFCKSCGQQLLKDIEYSTDGKKKPIFVILACVLVIGVLGAIAMVSSMPKPAVLPVDSVIIPDQPWASLKVYKKAKVETSEDPNAYHWKAQEKDTVYKEKDLIHLQINVAKEGFVYLIYAGSGQPSLIYPVSPVSNKALDAGASFTFPSQVSEFVEKNLQHLVGLELNNSPGVETFLILVSPEKLNLIGNSAAVEQVYKRATENIEGANSDTGIEEPLRRFSKGLIANDNLGNDESGEKSSSQDSIYIDRYLIKHVK